MNETCVIDQTVNIVSTEPPNPPLDTSTVIHETQADQSKKTDGSSIQIHMNSREQSKEISVEQVPLTMPSHDRTKFQSMVLAMTGLKDHQKVEIIRM